MEYLRQNINPILRISGCFCLFFTLVKGGADLIFILGCILILGFLEMTGGFFKLSIALPYWLFNLSPILLIHYSSIFDFKIRLVCFLFLAYIAGFTLPIQQRKFTLVTQNPSGKMIWGAGVIIFSLFSVFLYFKGVHLSGDEPHYIMMAQSLAEEGDLDLKNNVHDKTYLKFIPVEIKAHGVFHQGKLRPYHMPGVAFLLIPFYLLFNLLEGLIPPQLFFRLAAGIINGFFVLGLFMLLKKEFPQKDIRGFWLFMLCTFPLIFHCTHLYPELPAATLMIFAYLWSFTHKPNYIWSGLLLSLVPWFHLKYIPGLMVLSLAIIWPLLMHKKLKSLLTFLAFPFLSLVLLLVFSKVTYHSFNPTAVYPKIDLLAIPLLHQIKTFLAYLLDQRDGLLFYSPLFFLIFWGFSQKLKHRRVLMGILVVHLLSHAATTVRGAHSPAGRPLMFVIWIMILLIADVYFNRLTQHSGYRFLAGGSLFVLGFLLFHPLFAYQPVFHHTQAKASSLWLFLSSDHINIPQLLPSFLSHSGWSHGANYGWIILMVAIIIFGRWRVIPTPSQKILTLIMCGFFLLTTALFSLFPHVHIREQNRFTINQVDFYCNSRNLRQEKDQHFIIKAGGNYDLFIDPSRSTGSRIQIQITDIKGDRIRIRNGKSLLLDYPSGKRMEVHTSLNRLTSMRPGKLIHLGIETQTPHPHSFIRFKINVNPQRKGE